MSEPITKPFLRPGKLALLLLAAVLVYVVALVALVPAGWLWQQASARVSLPPQVQVTQVNGKLWGGAAGLRVAGYPVRAEWQLGWPSLASTILPVDFSLALPESSLSGKAVLGWPLNAQVNASGRVVVAEFEDLIRASGGAMIEGHVDIERLQLAWDGERITEARGLGLWAGGQVTWPMGNSVGRAQFPPMQAQLETAPGGVSLEVAAQGGAGPAARAALLWNGAMDLRVYKRMLDLAGQPWPESASPDDVVFRVRQQLLPGGRF